MITKPQSSPSPLSSSSSSSSSGIPVTAKSNMADIRNNNLNQKKTIIATKPPLVKRNQQQQRCTSISPSSTATKNSSTITSSARIIRNSLNTTTKSNIHKSTQPQHQRSTSTVTTITKTRSTIRTAITSDKNIEEKNISTIKKSKFDTQRSLQSKSKQIKMINESNDTIIKYFFDNEQQQHLDRKHRLIMDLCKWCRNIKLYTDNNDGNFENFIHTMDILLQLQISKLRCKNGRSTSSPSYIDILVDEFTQMPSINNNNSTKCQIF
uniref:Uncharacterized protein n=1 Tax=Dermatophagoides pteronyssinus TaxID=6956 RepID=A0A6P6XWN6_DERPT|nr:putative uncharacterized protein DDB_G0268590 [Dermatophagoides pteronyssinus]